MHPPGWYPSPHYPDTMQYWDGYEWTAQVQPRGSDLPKRNSRTGIRAFSGFFLFLGLVLLTLNVPAVSNDLMPSPSKVASGVVTEIDLNTMKANNGTPSGWVDKCKPTVEFEVNGARHEAHSQYYEWPCKWSVGQSTEVTYDPRHPESGATVGEVSNGPDSVTWIFLSIGSFLTLVCGSILALSFTRKKVSS